MVVDFKRGDFTYPATSLGQSLCDSVTDQGSPLLFNTQAQTDAIAKELQQRGMQHVVVDFAMRYGNPSFESVLEKMFAQGVRKLLVLPLYPQYSGSTSASTFDELAAHFTRRRWYRIYVLFRITRIIRHLFRPLRKKSANTGSNMVRPTN